MQKNLRRTGDLTVEESISHAEMVNMVSEGVRTAMENTECRSQEQALAANENALRQQIEEI